MSEGCVKYLSTGSPLPAHREEGIGGKIEYHEIGRLKRGNGRRVALEIAVAFSQVKNIKLQFLGTGTHLVSSSSRQVAVLFSAAGKF